MDGIDAVLVRMEQVNSTLHLKILGHHHQPYSNELHQTLHNFVTNQQASLQNLCVANYTVGRELASAAQALRRQHLDLEIDLIASHGQTIWHQPRMEAQRSTWQLGTPSHLVASTGITVVHDFRARDITEGGQGAPLVPLLDVLLFRHPTCDRVLLNLGGIANATSIPAGNHPDKQSLAFDIGPGNSLMDAVVTLATRGEQTFDDGGRLAAQGEVVEAVIEQMLRHPTMLYFDLPAPKSTGKEEFGVHLAQHFLKLCDEVPLKNLADKVATITVFTARMIARSLKMPECDQSYELIVSGGGTKNSTLMKLLSDLVDCISITTTDTHGLPSQHKEALAFALLGYMTLHGWPGNIPACTGANQPVVLGSVSPGANYLKLMRRTASSTQSPPLHAVLNY